MGAALRRAGEDDFIILEKGPTVGGVWRDNTYPGCTCDVPSHLYSFSFAPYQRHDKRFPPQHEILAYLQRIATEQDLLPRLHFNTEVAEARFHEDGTGWEIVTAVKERFCAEIVIFAVGQLHRANYPNLQGLSTFCGPVLHPAEWDNNIQFSGKNVSIIGTGSSAAQMLPIIASTAARVTVYQRNPQWVLPKPNADFGRITRGVLRVPGAHQLYRKALHYGADMLLSPIPRFKIWRSVVERYANHHLRRQVKDEVLMQKLTPEYPIGSKRVLFNSGFYPAVTRSNVTLITDPIQSIGRYGIKTVSDALPADVIICATGFKASEFLVPMAVHGREGHSLNDDWASGAEAFMGLAIPNYPNLFLIAGPNSFNPAGSNPEMKELQIAYIMKCLQWKRDSGSQAIEVRHGATAEYQKWLEQKMKKTVWRCSVQSWYKHESGKVTNPWPESVREFARLLRTSPARSFSKSESHVS